MRRLLRYIVLTLTVLIVMSAILLAGGCTAAKDEGFAIYLIREDISPAMMEALSHVEIAEKPVIGIEDIIAYDASTHEITLTAGAYDRVSSLEVPVSGRSFVVCVDRQPVYWGAFWTMLSSLSFEGVTIWKPLGNQESNVIQIELGYPTSSFYRGEDPRDSETVMDSLRQAGKLINTPSPAAEKLPSSFKRYELYSWQEYGEWHFTLITGTNRTKTLEEIVDTAYIVSEDGWVHIRVTGIDAVKDVLGRLPADEDVSWFGQPHSMELPQDDNYYFSLPPEEAAEIIREFAGECGLNLHTIP